MDPREILYEGDRVVIRPDLEPIYYPEYCCGDEDSLVATESMSMYRGMRSVIFKVVYGWNDGDEDMRTDPRRYVLANPDGTSLLTGCLWCPSMFSGFWKPEADEDDAESSEDSGMLFDLLYGGSV